MKAYWCQRCSLQVPMKEVGGHKLCAYCLYEVIEIDEALQGQRQLRLEYPSARRRQERDARWQRLKEAAE